MIYVFKTIALVVTLAASIYSLDQGWYQAAGWFGFFAFLSILFTGN